MITPNRLTAARIALTPVGMFFLVVGGIPGRMLWALVIFVVAMATDAADGFIARRYRMQSATGTFLDPLTDKIIVLAYAILLVGEGVFPGWLVALTVIRELIVDGYCAMVFARGFALPARPSGKIKTVVQATAIVVGLCALAINEGELPPIGISIDTIAFIASQIFLLGFLIGLDVFRGVGRARAE